MPFLIAGIFIAVAAIVAYTIRILRMEQTASKAQPVEPEVLGEDATGEGEEELVNLVEFFHAVPPEDEEDSDPQKQEGADLKDFHLHLHEHIEFDPLCDFKVGPSYIADCRQALMGASGDWAVACIDIDRFRYINSLKGMSIGDLVLMNLANQLRIIFPEESLITRVAADHFSVCFPLVGEDMLTHYAEELKLACEKIRNDIGSNSAIRLCMGVSITGNAVFEFSRDYDVMYYKANIARHCLKVSKFDTLSVYNDTMATTFLYGESALENYSENQYDEEITPYFQPQSDITRSRIVSAQALLRWTFEEIAHKDRPVSPDLGRMPSGASRMIYQVCSLIYRWRKNGKEVMPVQAYLPPTELFKEDIDDFAVKCLTEFQLEPNLLVLVIDISSFIIAPNIARLQVQKLHDIGVKTAVDGYIYGANRMDLLEDLPLDFVKIPRELTTGIEKHAERNAFLMSFQQSILRIPAKPIYEGINETPQMNAIGAMGGILVEGRYAGRPIIGEDFGRVLKEFVQKQRLIGDNTVILDNDEIQRGEYHI